MSKLAIAGFTNIGYLLHTLGQSQVEADMSGKTVLITGATGGLGRSAAMAVAGLGAQVIIVGRSPEKLRRAKNSTEGDVTTIEADLSLLAEVRDLAGNVAAGYESLDVLINNVGVLLPERSETAEGLETTFATNVAGHFLLTNLLAPKLVDSAPSRIINVTSGGMYAERIQPSDLQSRQGPYRGATAYARTKRAQVILTEMWAERLAGSGVTVHAMHPGWARTPGLQSSLPIFHTLMFPLLRTQQQGADTIVWLAAADEPALSTGRLWLDRRPVPTHLSSSTVETPEDRVLLWERLVDVTGSDLPVQL